MQCFEFIEVIDRCRSNLELYTYTKYGRVILILA
jgi:hypothetical protein